MWKIIAMVMTLQNQPVTPTLKYKLEKWSSKEACETFRQSEPFRLANEDFKKVVAERAHQDLANLVVVTKCVSETDPDSNDI